MKSGVPPTAPNARAGLLTPPGVTWRARSNAAALAGRFGMPGSLPHSTLRNRRGHLAVAEVLQPEAADRDRLGARRVVGEGHLEPAVVLDLLLDRGGLLVGPLQVGEVLVGQPPPPGPGQHVVLECEGQLRLVREA